MKKSAISKILTVVIIVLTSLALVWLALQDDKIQYTDIEDVVVPDFPGFLPVDLNLFQDGNDNRILAMLFSGDYFQNPETGTHAESFIVTLEGGYDEYGPSSFYSYKHSLKAGIDEQTIFIDTPNALGSSAIVGNEFVAHLYFNAGGTLWYVLHRQTIDAFFVEEDAKELCFNFIYSAIAANSAGYKLLPGLQQVAGITSYPILVLAATILTTTAIILLAVLIRFTIFRKFIFKRDLGIDIPFIFIVLELSVLFFDIVVAVFNILPAILFCIIIHLGSRQADKAIGAIHRTYADQLKMMGDGKAEVERKLAAQQTNTDDLRNELARTKRDGQQYSSQIANMKSQLDIAEKKVSMALSQLAQKEQDLKAAMGEIQTLRQQIWDSVDKKSQEEAIKSYKERIESLQKENLQLQEEMRRMSRPQKPKKKGKEDYEKILGLENGYTKEDLKHARKELAKEFHEDRLQNCPQKIKDYANSMLADINEAYNALLKNFS